MKLHLAGALLLSASLLAGCPAAPTASSGEPDQRIRELASHVGAQTVGFASVSPDSVSLQYISLGDGSPKFASTDAFGQVTIKDYPAINEVAYLTRPVALDQLQLETFTARLGAMAATCPKVHGSLYVTHGGSILQEIGCAPVGEGVPPEIHATYLGAKQVETLTRWDEASLATALQEARQLIGDRAVFLDFVGSEETAFVGYRAMSEPMAGPYAGWTCNVVALRFGEAQEQVRQVSHLGCAAMIAPDRPTTFSLQDVKPAALVAAIAAGAEALGVPVVQIRQFEVVWEDPSRLQLEVSTNGPDEEPRKVVVPLG